ncbi:MAG: S8 family serine peptidase [Schleiferiaceae bacterium]|nr:S8 family serine peptidase [Schleiferiaceae bacterium]
MVRFLVFLLTFTSFAAQAQLKVQLKSGTYHIAEGTFKQLSNTQATYGVGLWDRVVLAEDKKALTDLGVELGHYLPKNAFEVKIPAGVTIAQLRDAGLSAFVKWTPRMKLDGPLAIGDWPEWAVLNNGHVAIQFKTTENWKAPAYVSQVMDLDDEWHTAVLKPELLTQLSENNDVLFIQAIEEPGTPENFNSRAAARTSYIQGQTPFDGSNVVVGLGDDGDIGPHADYKGRLTSLAGNSIGDHGDHVAGTIFGAGNIDPTGEGNAPGATMIYYDYPSNLSNIDAHYASYGIRVTNSSYSNGCNAGYTFYAQQMDKDVRDNAALIHVFSAGNSNGSNCGYGAGTQWGNVTGGHKQGKNVIATANITSTDAIAPSSSRGPAADGRIKPDLAAVGTNVYSTIDSHTYGNKTGTSMSAPGVAGYFAVLHNAFDELQQDTAEAGLLKAIAMNTADDLGNPGPDFIYGYGRVNAHKALKVIQDTQFLSSSITTNDTLTYTISIPTGVNKFSAMLYWTDKEASTSASKALVNNLDFEVTDLTGATTYQPWVLDPTPNTTTLLYGATRGVDTLNNVEQVTLDAPNSGDYRFTVYGTNIPQGPQTFYIVYAMDIEKNPISFPHKDAKLVPGANYVRWNGAASLTWEYSTDSMSTWTSVGLSATGGNRVANWNVPNVATKNAFLRNIQGTDTAIAGPFIILNAPNNLNLDWACPDSIKISFSPVTGATDYTAYILGTTYMDSVYSGTVTSMIIPYQPVNGTWLSVSGGINNVQGRRAYAVQLPSGTNACPLPRDGGISALLSPQFITSCQNPVQQVSITVTNPSAQVLDTLPVAMTFGTTTVRDTFYGSLASYADTSFTFATPIVWSGTNTQTLKIWSELSGDQNSLNDTVVQSINYYNSSLYGLPFTQNFDSFSNCGTTTNCGGTVCSLGGDFINLTNGSDDDIDWRTNSGSTASSGTGPSSGTGGSGKYLYLEASGNCEFQEALLYTPCIDLAGSIAPELRFAYHMNGPNQGSLEVAIFNGSSWSILFTQTGNQGNNWNNVAIDISSYTGDTVLFRFKGITGDNYQSDLAIDAIEVEDNIGIPVVDFAAVTNTPCLNTGVVLEDLSSKSPTSWNWSITPSSHSFINGTSSSSQNPEVSFSAYGAYTITLIASNAYGADTLVLANAVTVSPLPSLPFVETWTGNGSVAFTTENPDGSTSWTKGEVTGPTGAKSEVMYMNYFNYSTVGAEDGLLSEKFDINGYNPVLYFDVSYAPYSSAYSDSLVVEVSTDCGASFTRVYAKDGTSLATTANSQSQFIPGGSTDWRTDSVALSNSNGDFIQFRIKGIGGYGNNLYIDNIRVISSGTPATATLNVSPICEDTPFSFDLSSSDTTLNGVFTLNRQGSSLLSTYQGMGAHAATLNIATDYDLEYAYYNAYTFVADSAVLVPGPKLDADFALQNTSGFTYQFTDQSTPAPTAWFWDFGDGTTSTAQNPVHTFAANGPTTVKLVVTTDCGLDSIIVPFTNIGLEEDGAAALVVYPNPTSGLVHIQPRAAQGKVMMQIIGMNGALIEESVFTASTERITLDLGAYAGGFYQIKVTTDNYVQNVKITKY